MRAVNNSRFGPGVFALCACRFLAGDESLRPLGAAGGSGRANGTPSNTSSGIDRSATPLRVTTLPRSWRANRDAARSKPGGTAHDLARCRRESPAPSIAPQRARRADARVRCLDRPGLDLARGGAGPRPRRFARPLTNDHTRAPFDLTASRSFGRDGEARLRIPSPRGRWWPLRWQRPTARKRRPRRSERRPVRAARNADTSWWSGRRRGPSIPGRGGCRPWR